MEKRQCQRFNAPGTTLYYKMKRGVFHKEKYSEDYFPVLDISRGGLRFLTNDRIKVGLPVQIRLTIPGVDFQPEIKAIVRWISKNREESYRYQTGVSFNAYGDRKKENPLEILAFIESLETEHGPLEQI